MSHFSHHNLPVVQCLPVEVAIHTILYTRQIYPADLFIRRKKYDTPVFQSRHPALNEYISGAVKAIGEELALVSASIDISVARRSTMVPALLSTRAMWIRS